VEDVILSKRRFSYEDELKTNLQNYDVWFDYVRLEESSGNHARVREVYVCMDAFVCICIVVCV
jgi:crooked neck